MEVGAERHCREEEAGAGGSTAAAEGTAGLGPQEELPGNATGCIFAGLRLAKLGPLPTQESKHFPRARSMCGEESRVGWGGVGVGESWLLFHPPLQFSR